MKSATPNALLKSRAGFTLLELVIVVAIMAVLATVGVVSLSGFRGKQNLKKTTDEVVAAIVGTQKRSISQDAGKRWNIRFSNTTTSDQYIVFSGLSYATSAVDRAYGVSRNMQFSEPASGNLFDAMFAPFTGTLPSKKIISLVDGRKDGFVGDIILNTAGRVTERMENGLVGYWHMDEGNGTTTYDASGNGNNGILYSSSTICANPPTGTCPTWQAGTSCNSGSCISFDGGSNYNFVQLNNLPVNTAADAENTVEFWMYWTGAAGDMPFAFAGYDVYFSGSSTFGFNTGCGEVWGVSSTGLANKWVHVAAIFHNSSSTQSRLFINGVQQNLSLAGSACVRSASAAARIAYWSYNGTNNFGGSIDEVRIYNRALSATEILTMYNDLK